MKFDFGDNNKAKTTGNAFLDIGTYYKSHTVPRGGYGQPLPGKWTGLNAGKKGPLFLERWVNVIETNTADRFRVAIGPVGPNCTNEVHFAEGSYEEKIFCVPSDDSREREREREIQS